MPQFHKFWIILKIYIYTPLIYSLGNPIQHGIC